MIQIPRDLVRRSAAELSKLRGWKRHPCGSLKHLIYGLNSIVERQPLLEYRHGFPKPSVAVRDLERVHSLCKKSRDACDCTRLVKRIEVLITRDSDSYGLLLFQAGRLLEKNAPERAITDGRALELLREVARTQPSQLADMSHQALEALRPLAKSGRGGDRNLGAQSKRDLIRDLGFLFEKVTERRPGVTYSHYKSTYGGPFVEFVRTILGPKITGRQVYRLLKATKMGAAQGKHRQVDP
jgi:hypothetical protein